MSVEPVLWFPHVIFVPNDPSESGWHPTCQHPNTTKRIPSYADVARTPPSSQPSNLMSLPSTNTTPSTMTDTLYYTVDTSRVEEEDKSKAQPGAMWQAIERTAEGHESWRCVAVIRDPRNTTRVRVTCRNEAELQLVKEAAQKSSATTACAADQLYPVKIDNANRTGHSRPRRSNSTRRNGDIREEERCSYTSDGMA